MRSLKKSLANPFTYEYGVGISALNQKPEKVTNDIKKAIQEAFLAGLNFIVEKIKQNPDYRMGVVEFGDEEVVRNPIINTILNLFGE
jgi:hypothetical protein